MLEILIGPGGVNRSHHFMMAFLPYSLLIVLICRSVRHKAWQIKSTGDLVMVLLATALSFLGAITYHFVSGPLELGFNLRLEKFKAKYGSRGFGLVKAYALAIVLTILCIFRNSHAQAKTIQSVAVVQISATEEKPETPIFPEVVAVIIRYFNNLLQKMKRKIIFIIQKNIFLFVKQPLEFVWGLWARPPDVIAKWCVKANGFRAPAMSVICALNSRNQITSFKGVFHENQNIFSFFIGVHRLGFCPG